MQIMVGQSRLEQAATRMNDAKAKEMEHNTQQPFVQDMEEEVSDAGVVLEVREVGAEDSCVSWNETKKLEQIEGQDKEQKQKELVLRKQRNQQINSAKQRHVLENINIP